MRADQRKSKSVAEGKAHFTVHESLQKCTNILQSVHYLPGPEFYFSLWKQKAHLTHNPSKQMTLVCPVNHGLCDRTYHSAVVDS